jgi:fructose-bisphosphate aldolase class II
MPLRSMCDMLGEGKRKGYGIGAFNVFNLETIRGVIEAAEAERSPVIMQVWAGIFQFGTVTPWGLGAILKAEAENARVPVCVHLDHGESEEPVIQAIRNGFVSVMIDASTAPFVENVRITKRIVELARFVDVAVEAELGHVPANAGTLEKSGGAIFLTNPDEAEKFASETGIDSLAVSIGTIHGQFRETPKLDFDRLKEIASRVSIPLVLHGSSYVPDSAIAEAVRLGITKINVATELNQALIERFSHSVREGATFPNEMFDAGKNAVMELVRRKMRLFKSAGKA